jgi:carboxyl-terminal processing protease
LTLGTGIMAGFGLSLAGRVFADRAAAPGLPVPALAIQGEALPWKDARLLAEVLQRVRESYVDPVDDHQLMRQAVHGLVESLDEHSTLLEPGDYAELQAATSGSYAGIGVEVNGVADGVVCAACRNPRPCTRASGSTI